MASEVTVTGGEAREVWETEACLARARAVHNAIATAVSNLLRTDVPPEWHDRARATIDVAWKTLGRRSVATEYRLRLMREVDKAATTNAQGVGAGEEVLARLPPELIMALGSDAVALGRVVEAWRKRTPGLAAGAARGKWAALAELWERATGEVTKAPTWEETWKNARGEQKKILDRAVARAAAANAERSPS